jgi:multicomponent Na+:H+ antiporter subunit E
MKPRRVARVMAAILLRTGLFAMLWWVLAEGRADSWGVGAVSLVVALAASLYLAPPGSGRLSPSGLLGFVGFFLIQSLKGGIQVAARAFRPRMDLAPALLEVPINLPEAGIARVLLVNTLNLLPGTLSVAIMEDVLRLHVLDQRLPVIEEVRAAEARIARMLGLAL